MNSPVNYLVNCFDKSGSRHENSPLGTHQKGKDGQASKKRDGGRQESGAALQEIQWILLQITW